MVIKNRVNVKILEDAENYEASLCWTKFAALQLSVGTLEGMVITC